MDRAHCSHGFGREELTTIKQTSELSQGISDSCTGLARTLSKIGTNSSTDWWLKELDQIDSDVHVCASSKRNSIRSALTYIR